MVTLRGFTLRGYFCSFYLQDRLLCLFGFSFLYACYLRFAQANLVLERAFTLRGYTLRFATLLASLTMFATLRFACFASLRKLYLLSLQLRDVHLHPSFARMQMGGPGEGPLGPVPPGSLTAKLDFRQRRPWRAPVPHEGWGCVSSLRVNDGTAYRIQGIRVLWNKAPY